MSAEKHALCDRSRSRKPAREFRFLAPSFDPILGLEIEPDLDGGIMLGRTSDGRLFVAQEEDTKKDVSDAGNPDDLPFEVVYPEDAEGQGTDKEIVAGWDPHPEREHGYAVASCVACRQKVLVRDGKAAGPDDGTLQTLLEKDAWAELHEIGSASRQFWALEGIHACSRRERFFALLAWDWLNPQVTREAINEIGRASRQFWTLEGIHACSRQERFFALLAWDWLNP
jgi:hypothetical protein